MKSAFNPDALQKANQKSGIVRFVVALAFADAQIVVSAEIDFIVRGWFIIVDVDVQIIIVDRILFLLRILFRRGLERQWLLGFQNRFGHKAFPAFDACCRVFLAQIVKACSTFRACTFCAPFRFNHGWCPNPV